jgi:hypothetical protein
MAAEPLAPTGQRAPSWGPRARNPPMGTGILMGRSCSAECEASAAAAAPVMKTDSCRWSRGLDGMTCLFFEVKYDATRLGTKHHWPLRGLTLKLALMPSPGLCFCAFVAFMVVLHVQPQTPST